MPTSWHLSRPTHVQLQWVHCTSTSAASTSASIETAPKPAKVFNVRAITKGTLGVWVRLWVGKRSEPDHMGLPGSLRHI